MVVANSKAWLLWLLHTLPFWCLIQCIVSSVFYFFLFFPLLLYCNWISVNKWTWTWTSAENQSKAKAIHCLKVGAPGSVLSIEAFFFLLSANIKKSIHIIKKSDTNINADWLSKSILTYFSAPIGFGDWRRKLFFQFF